jgi:hypothetical protein
MSAADVLLVIAFLGSSAWLVIALKYGIVGGGGGATSRSEHPISFWIGVTVVAIGVAGSFIALVATAV